jgi:hypothetical protein
VFDVPSIGDDSAVFVSDLECSRSEYLVNDEWPLPWRRDLVLILAILNSLEDQVSDLELMATHVTLVVVS